MRRVIEYTGTRHWIEETMRKSVIFKTGEYRCAFGTIKQIALLEFQMRSDDRPSNGGGTRRGKKIDRNAIATQDRPVVITPTSVCTAPRT